MKKLLSVRAGMIIGETIRLDAMIYLLSLAAPVEAIAYADRFYFQ